jgi:septal ring factor EnvC (AmiA/AmiB activator)
MLDPALIRRGRMDRHIEMSYCSFEAFKVLANNYLDIDEHKLFGEIRQLFQETDMTPADVAENLMPMSKKKKADADACLVALVEALKKSKEDAAAKAKEEEEAKKAKEEEEAKEKAKKDEGQDKVKDGTSDSSKEKTTSNGDIVKGGDK